ncbi:nucleotidyltransferase domain-containing protein [bacterium]|nr:nucleotidyltransferase domain-containing protein [bacterium]MBU1754156.1 nucleotidyltransferase domain-containing protein [bacterium]
MQRESFENELVKIISISKDFGAEKVLLFGSCLKEIELARDIDIAVSGIEPKEFFKYYGKVSMMVEDEVDIVDLDDVREHLYKKILSKGRVMYERKI